jgi:hypothetical protein
VTGAEKRAPRTKEIEDWMAMKKQPQPRIQVSLALPSRHVSERSSVPVWVSSVEELRQELVSRGAVRLLLCYDDAVGDRHTEGTWFSLDELREEQLEWLSVKGWDVRELAFDFK